MDSTGKIWVALDIEKAKALEIAAIIAKHPAVFGFKVNRLVDQEVFRKDGEPMLFDELSAHQLSIWVDIKLHDIERTVFFRIEPYIRSGQVQFLSVMAKGEVDMMMMAIEAMDNKGRIIGVTELTSLSEEQVHLGSGHPSKASVIQLARNVVISGGRHLVCSSQELKALSGRQELKCLDKFIPAITPAWKSGDEPDQKRTGTPAFALTNGGDKIIIGSAIVNADDPLEALEKTVAEIEAIEE